MNQLTSLPLWVGHAGDGRAYQELCDRGIRAIVQLAAEEPPVEPPRDFVVCRFPLIDGGGNDLATLQLAIKTVVGLIAGGVPTLVCCGGGMSRAPAVAAAAISLVEERSPADCLKAIAAGHPSDVTPRFWDEVTRAAQLLSAP